jgi:hypothetical protein
MGAGAKTDMQGESRNILFHVSWVDQGACIYHQYGQSKFVNLKVRTFMPLTDFPISFEFLKNQLQI